MLESIFDEFQANQQKEKKHRPNQQVDTNLKLNDIFPPDYEPTSDFESLINKKSLIGNYYREQFKSAIKKLPNPLINNDNEINLVAEKYFNKYNDDSNLFTSILVDLSKHDRFAKYSDINNHTVSDLKELTYTTSPSSSLDWKAIAILESRQQQIAIILSKDFKNALAMLVEEEKLSHYDLTKLIGITRAMLSQWKDRPLEKVRTKSEKSIGRLLFAWKYWLHVSKGDILGPFIRYIPEGSTVSLIDLLSNENVTEEEIALFLDRLANYAETNRNASLRHRREIGGLPDGAHRFDLVL
jgi:hypothetical protein